MTGTVGTALRPCQPLHRPQRGLGAVTVILVLVALAALAAAVLRLGLQGQTVSQQDVVSTRAAAAARSGIEWGLYQALKGGWTSCSNASQTLDMGAADASGLRVTVSCDSRSYNEGETSPGVPRVVRLITLDAVACNSASAATACPDAGSATLTGYVERRRQVHVSN